MTKCHYCGTASDLEQAFQKVPRSFSRKFRLVCPECLQKRRAKSFRRLLWFWLGYTIVGVALAFVPKWHMVGYYLLNCLLVDLFLLLVILPHELGHAIAGKLVGFRVFRIVVGAGRTFHERRMLGFKLELKTIPIG